MSSTVISSSPTSRRWRGSARCPYSSGWRRTTRRITGIFTGNRELTRLLPAVDLLGVDTDAAALRAGLKQMFGPPRP